MADNNRVVFSPWRPRPLVVFPNKRTDSTPEVCLISTPAELYDVLRMARAYIDGGADAR